MVIIRDNSLYETDDYDKIQEAFEGYLYGSHRGLDENKKDCWQDYYEMLDYRDEDIIDSKEVNYRIHKVIK